MTVPLPSGADLSAPSEGSVPSAKARDAGLARRIAERDGEALSQVLDEQFTRVFAVARRMVGNDTDAEDIAQDVFLRLWRVPPDLSDERALLSTWLYRVTSNLSFDWLRRKRPEPLDDRQEMPGTEPAPDASAAGHQVARQVDAALAGLPDRQRLALALTYYEGLTNTETADVMETSVEAVESLLARARRGVRGTLDGQWRDLLDAIGDMDR
ncbi:MAG: sigma-70 family RNA polymerase sigma factor [Hyphomicrobiales bacterium]